MRGEPLTDAEIGCVSTLMRGHPDYTDGWRLCRHLSLNGQWYSFCVLGRGDKEPWPVSYSKFFMPHATAVISNRAKAYRSAVRQQIVEFRGSSPGEVDHQPPVFSELCKQFEQVLGYQPVALEPTGGLGWVLPPEVIGLWQRFHLEHARLQLLPSDLHKKITRQRRDTE